MRETAKTHGSRPGFVTVGKGATQWTYSEVFERVRKTAAALKDLGLVRGDQAVIFAENSPEWALFDWACQVLGVIVVPIYPTLPPDQAAYIVRDSGAKLAVAGSPELLAKLASVPEVRQLPLLGEGSLMELSKGLDLSASELDAEIDAAKPEDPCTIIYTSGTTGIPKGAVMPNRAFVHVAITAPKALPLSFEDTFFSFLPMSHVYERVAGQVLPVALGSTIVYSRGLPYIRNELAEAQPHIMLCVPRFLESFRERILDNAAKAPPLRKRLFAVMLSQGTAKARGRFAPLAGLLDKIVAAKVRAVAGGKLRYFVSGGSALAPAVAEFYLAVGLPILQGYGLTETSGGSCLNRPNNNKYWTVGEPLDMEVKIAEDGEILMRGQGLMLGYYNLPEETAKVIDTEGWFHTGDIGEWEGKNLKITDRKKDLLVLGNGKNVAPQPIENKLKSSTYIAEAVVLGDGLDHCVALILPRAELVRSALGLAADAPIEDNKEVRQLLKKEIDAVNKTGASFEAVKKFAVLDTTFSIDSGELTPTLKVKRKVVKERYADIIQTLS